MEPATSKSPAVSIEIRVSNPWPLMPTAPEKRFQGQIGGAAQTNKEIRLLWGLESIWTSLQADFAARQ